MTFVRRCMAPAIAGATLAIIGPLRAMADTGPRPVGGDAVIGDTVDLTKIVVLGVVTVVVAMAAIVSIRRPGWRRPFGAVLTVIGSSLVALILVGAGLFSDFSGRHTIYPQLLIGGSAVFVVGLVVAARIVMGGRRAPDDEAEGGPDRRS